MKMDRKRIVLAALAVLLLAFGCAKKPPVIEPPPPAPPPPPPPVIAPTPAPAVDEVEKEPPKSLQQRGQDAVDAGLLGDVFFDFDKYELRSDARERLSKNAEFMRSAAGSDLTFTIEGHCDERGTNEYNIALGQSRSTTAIDYLVSLGITAGRFRTISYGEERPFCRESSESCWQRNRRARFVVSGSTAR